MLTGGGQFCAAVASIATAAEAVGVETLVGVRAVGGEFGNSRTILSSLDFASVLSPFVVLGQVRY